MADEKADEQPTDGHTEKPPADKSADTPAAKPSDTPADKPAATPPAADKGTKDAKAPTDTGDGKPGGKDGADDGKPKAPEKYTLTLPTGERITKAELDTFTTYAHEQGWTQEQAQEHVNTHAAALQAQAEAFLEETRADKTYGGDKLAETQRLANTILDRVRPAGTARGDALRSMLNRSGYNNNLEIISFLADLGRMGDEDRNITGRQPGPPKKDAATVLYGETAH